MLNIVGSDKNIVLNLVCREINYIFFDVFTCNVDERLRSDGLYCTFRNSLAVCFSGQTDSFKLSLNFSSNFRGIVTFRWRDETQDPWSRIRTESL